MRNSKKSKSVKLIGIPASVIFGLTCVIQGILQNLYVGYPRIPNVENGRVVPYSVKGVIVYITKSQSEILDWLFWICVISGVVTIILAVILGEFSSSAKK